MVKPFLGPNLGTLKFQDGSLFFTIARNIPKYINIFHVEHENHPLPSNLEASNMSPPGIYTSLQTAKSKRITYFNR
jgi:hypothetical protein